jgi:2-oxoacid:acceptor oxidoreductase gamma subunit (pyruvate/2-ketoisovalerate family)
MTLSINLGWVHEMIEIRFQGRGGQGVVVASEILSRACFEEGRYAQCFSVFGGERRGAPVASFIRISDEKIYLKCDIERPGHLVFFDGSLFDEKRVSEQITLDGVLLLNTHDVFQFGALGNLKVGRINALEISKNNGLGSIVNTAILGAYVRLTKIVGLESLLTVIEKTVPAATEQNIAAAKEAYEKLSII